MAKATTYDPESFTTAIKEGLKLLDPTGYVESSSYPSLLPTAPVVYAAVAPDVSPGGFGDPQQLALLPLQIRDVSVKVFAEALPSSIRVRYKVTCVVPEKYMDSALTLAVPVGHGGNLVNYKMEVPDFSGTKLYEEEVGHCRPLSKTLYLLSLPQAKVSYKSDVYAYIMVNYVQDYNMIDGGELYSFTVPLSIPSYVFQFRSTRRLNEQIRVTFECKGAGSIKNCDIPSHPLIGIVTKEKKRVFLQQSYGYSDKDLECSFKVASSIRGQLDICREESSFIRAFEEGLRLVCAPRGTSFPMHSTLPTSPVLFAMVSNLGLLNIETPSVDLAFHFPALVPLQMTWLSVKVDAELKPDSVHVRFKSRWSVHCIRKGSSSPLILAVPVGHRGCLLRYEVRVPSNGQILKTEELTTRSGPQLQNLYLLPLPEIEGDADVCIQFSYIQDVIQQHGAFSFSIPLSVPSYVSHIAGDSSIKERIRLTIKCRDSGGAITEFDIPSHHMMELISDEKVRVFQHESLTYSSKDLTCSFKLRSAAITIDFAVWKLGHSRDDSKSL